MVFLNTGKTIPGAYLLKRGLFLPDELPSILGQNITEKGLQELNLFENFDSHFDKCQNAKLNISSLRVQYLHEKSTFT